MYEHCFLQNSVDVGELFEEVVEELLDDVEEVEERFPENKHS